MSKGKFWLRGSYVVYTGIDGHYWKLPQGQFILNCKLPPQSQVKCSFLDIVTNCVRVNTGLFSSIWISGDAMITLYNMDYKKNPNLKELHSTKKSEINSKYEDLLTNHPEFFDASEMKKESADNYVKKQKQKEKNKKEYTNVKNFDLRDYWDSLSYDQQNNIRDQYDDKSLHEFLNTNVVKPISHSITEYTTDSGGSETRKYEKKMNSFDITFSTSEDNELQVYIDFLVKHKSTFYAKDKSFFGSGDNVEYEYDSAIHLCYSPLSNPNDISEFLQYKFIFDFNSFIKKIKSEDSYVTKSEFNNIMKFLEFFKTKCEEYLKNADTALKSRDTMIEELDTDNNGIIDVAEGSDDFMKLVRKIQNEVKVEDHHMQDFIKLSKYIKQTKKDIQKIFEWIKESQNVEYINEYVGVLKNQINHLESMLLHSISMVVALKENDKATFYEIHEAFDEMNVFDSQWQKDISEKLSDVSSGLSELISSVDSMNRNITESIKELTYITDKNFKSLNSSISSELNSINSSIKFNNLLSVVQNYQSFKLNKKLV